MTTTHSHNKSVYYAHGWVMECIAPTHKNEFDDNIVWNNQNLERCGNKPLINQQFKTPILPKITLTPTSFPTKFKPIQFASSIGQKWEPMAFLESISLNQKQNNNIPNETGYELTEIECFVCMESKKEINYINKLICCDKTICSHCSKIWFKNHLTCPHCRYEFPSEPMTFMETSYRYCIFTDKDF